MPIFAPKIGIIKKVFFAKAEFGDIVLNICEIFANYILLIISIFIVSFFENPWI